MFELCFSPKVVVRGLTIRSRRGRGNETILKGLRMMVLSYGRRWCRGVRVGVCMQTSTWAVFWFIVGLSFRKLYVLWNELGLTVWDVHVHSVFRSESSITDDWIEMEGFMGKMKTSRTDSYGVRRALLKKKTSFSYDYSFFAPSLFSSYSVFTIVKKWSERTGSVWEAVVL